MLDDIKKTLWATADKLRANMDAAEYKHLVLGLIFIKYISDSFEAHKTSLTQRLRNPEDELFYGDASDEDIAAELEDRDYFTAANVFWVPHTPERSARWAALQAAAPQPDIGKRIDDALTLIEQENPRLKGILDKRFARAQLPDGKLGELVNLVATIGFGENPSAARDILGQVYEYFLGMFASAEGKRGGQFYTPASIVKTLVEVLAPTKGQVYDPCCGSSGMFVQSEKFIEAHGGKLGDMSIYGQEANPTTWRLAAMNLVIRGMDYNLGKEPADTFTKNQHPDLRADYCLANPPFNISDWWHPSLDGDARWVYGTPPAGNANYAWLQHILHHLKPTGRAGIVLANGSMSSSQNSEGQIRAAMVDADVVEVMVALPGQLFFNTQIPACLWFLAKQKSRKGEVLFIDARKQGRMITLEAIAQALFKSWFVDFDPVHAKMQGRAPEGMDEATAALFPDSFEDSELGPVPKGWRVGTLADLATFQNGYAFKSKDWSDAGHPVVKIGNVKPALISFDGCSYVGSDCVVGLDRFQLRRGDLLVGMTGYVGETGLVTEVSPAAYLNQRVGRIATSAGVKDTLQKSILCVPDVSHPRHH